MPSDEFNIQTKAYFRPGDEAAFHAMIQAQLNQDILTTVSEEAHRLNHIFNACVRLTAPTGRKLSVNGLADLVAAHALYYQTILFNKPFLFDENFIGRKYPYISLPSDLTRQGRKIYTYPSGRETIMFYTAPFGFIQFKEHWNINRKSNPQAVHFTFPFIILPSEFLDLAEMHGAEDLLEAMQNISIWSDHDWFHNFTVGTTLFNDQLTGITDESPARRHLQYHLAGEGTSHKGTFGNKFSALNEACMNRTLDGGAEGQTGYDGFEAWAMRFHRLVMTELLRDASEHNPVVRGINDYVQAWSKFYHKTKDMPAMEKRPIKPFVFAARFLAFHLFRMAPIDHPVVQGILHSQTLSAEEQSAMRRSFKLVYGHHYKKVLYGAGMAEGYMETVTQKDVDEYEDGVIRASAHALELALEDAAYLKEKVALEQEEPEITGRIYRPHSLRELSGGSLERERMWESHARTDSPRLPKYE